MGQPIVQTAGNPEFTRLYKVSTEFEALAKRTRMSNLDAMTVTAFTQYKLLEPFRVEFIGKLRAVRAKYPPPPSSEDVPRVFGFIAKPVIEYLTHVRTTANWPHAWRIDRQGDRLNPDILSHVLNPQSPRYFDSADNKVETYVQSPGALRLVERIRAQDWQPKLITT